MVIIWLCWMCIISGGRVILVLIGATKISFNIGRWKELGTLENSWLDWCSESRWSLCLESQKQWISGKWVESDERIFGWPYFPFWFIMHLRPMFKLNDYVLLSLFIIQSNQHHIKSDAEKMMDLISGYHSRIFLSCCKTVERGSL